MGEGDPGLDSRLSDELTTYNYAASGVTDQRELTVQVADESGSSWPA